MRQVTGEIPRDRWEEFFNTLDRQARGRWVTVEWISPELGDQLVAQKVRLEGISLNDRAGTELEVDLTVVGEAGFDHLIPHPARLYAAFEPHGLASLDIEDSQGGKSLIRFEQPLELPERGAPGGRMAGDFMVSAPVTVQTGSSIAQARRLMVEHAVRHLPVLNDHGELVGVLSDRELALAKTPRGIRPDDVMVEEVMAKEPFSITLDTPIEEVAAVMATRKYGCAPVVQGRRVIGILTTTDVLRALVSLRTVRAPEQPAASP